MKLIARLGLAAVAAALLVPLPALAQAPAPTAASASASASATSEDYGLSAWRERAHGLVVIVDSYPASIHRTDAFIPVPIAVGFRGKTGDVTFDQESFVLVDDHGHEHPLAPYSDVAGGKYGKLSFDRTLLRQHPLPIGEQFSTMRRIASSFFPSPADGGGTRIETVQLAPFTWFNDVLYFPRPGGSMSGQMTLRVKGQGMKEPVEVRFRVPAGTTKKAS